MPAIDSPLPAEQLAALRVVAEQAARAGGSIARNHFGRDLHVELKADRSEVSAADMAAQNAVCETIRAARPSDALLGEETLSEALRAIKPSDDIPTWVIDPIDGTRNYVRGIPFYACSVGVMVGGFPVAGAVLDPSNDTLYSGDLHAGVHLNGRPLDGQRAPAAAAVATRPVVGLPSQAAGRVLQVMHTWIDRFVTRNFGSSALHLALVATGQLQATLFADCRLWDIAGAWPLLAAAGGVLQRLDRDEPVFPLRVASYQNDPIPAVAAASPELLKRLLEQK